MSKYILKGVIQKESMVGATGPVGKDRMKIMIDRMNSFDPSYFSIDWIIKMFGLERNEVRKYKINKLFENE
jgi:hypothetical protein